MRKHFLKIVIAICITGFIGYRLSLLYQKITAPHPMPPTIVSTAAVRIQNLPLILPAVGTLSAVNAVKLAVAVDGTVRNIPVQSGQTVNRDDLILQLEDDVEQADIKRFQSAFTLSQLALQRTTSLTSQKVQSQSTLDQRRADDEQNKAQLLKAQGVVKRKQLRAPFAGVLGIIHVDIGEYVKPGTMIVSLTDSSKLYVNFTRPEQDKSLLKTGQLIDVVVDAFPRQKFQGVITSIESQIDEDTRVFAVQASLDNPDNCLSPGMYAAINVIIPKDKASITVPETAIDYSLYGTSIYTITRQKDEKTQQDTTLVHRKAVKIGRPYHGFVEILDGLHPQDHIVTAGVLKLQDNMPVIINNDIQLQLQPFYQD